MRSLIMFAQVLALSCCGYSSKAEGGLFTDVIVSAPTLKMYVSPHQGTSPLTIKANVSCGFSDPCSTYTWQFSDGSPESSGATVTHTFSHDGVYDVTVIATDAEGKSASSKQTVIVNVASKPDNRYCKSDGTWVGTTRNNPIAYDGPAALPQHCILTAPWNMPSQGTIIRVEKGQDLMSAYNAASCGQTLSLAHGGVWNGPFEFAAKNCDDQHWITITSDGKLPGGGVRISPGYAGEMAKFSIRSGYSTFGDHIRLIGIEWAKQPGKLLYGFVTMKGANKIVIERNYFHGNPGEELQHGVIVNTGQSIAVIDSYFEEFHCIALTGACSDAQAIGGGSGGVSDPISQSGPVKIVNNFLEASGENILFGGGGGDGCPNDIEIRRNYLYKPLAWNPSDSSYTGTIKYITKNLLEFKNGCRVLVEGNVLENSWGGFTQRGYAVLLTPKNQSGDDYGENLCPNCAVTDVTVRYNYISTAAGAFSLGSGASSNMGWSQGQHRTSIHDNIAENLQYPTCYECGVMLFELGSGYNAEYPPQASAVLSDLSISNLTIIATGTAERPSALLNIGSVPPNVGIPQATNISFRNSIVATQFSGMYTTGGGTNNCMYFAARPATPKTEWEACFAGNSPFTGNVLVGYPGEATDWPKGNFLAQNWETVQFIDYKDGFGGDYHLSANSQYKNPDADGKDPGADIDKVNEMIKGVRQHPNTVR